jgi:hypothetical protein
MKAELRGQRGRKKTSSSFPITEGLKNCSRKK